MNVAMPYLLLLQMLTATNRRHSKLDHLPVMLMDGLDAQLAAMGLQDSSGLPSPQAAAPTSSSNCNSSCGTPATPASASLAQAAVDRWREEGSALPSPAALGGKWQSGNLWPHGLERGPGSGGWRDGEVNTEAAADMGTSAVADVLGGVANVASIRDKGALLPEDHAPIGSKSR